MQQRTNTSSLQGERSRALDGLRAFAIFGVVVYHLRLPWLPSGHLGVVIFLVLAGYLTTNSLVRKAQRRGKLEIADLLGTWWNRLRRLWPSVAALVAIVIVLCAWLSPVLLTKMRPDVMPALGFYENWSYIVRGTSYFDQIGGSSPVLHLWYLGVDLQFFLVWTLLLVFLLRAGEKVARYAALVLAVASAAWMAYLYVPGVDPSRVYYGTDTRAFSLLFGAWLAFVFPLGKEPVLFRRLLVRDIPNRGIHTATPFRATILAHLLGLAAVVGLVALMVLIPSDYSLYFRGGLVVVSLLTVILIATLLAPGSLMERILSLPPLAFLGTRSFALYLWHYPIFQLMHADKTTTPWYLRLAAVAIALVAAELSLRLIERPFASRPKARGAEPAAESAKHPRNTRLIVTTIVLVAVGAYAAYAYHTTADQTLVPEDAIVSTGEAADQAMQLDRPAGQADGTSSAQAGDSDATATEHTDDQSSGAKTTKVNVTDSTVLTAPASETSVGKYDPVLIGDSVPGDADWSVRLPDALIDSYIGRRPDQALEVIRGYMDQGVVGNVVVYACFSNTTPYPQTLDELIDAVGSDRKVYLVGTVNPDGFQDEANANLQDAAARYENVQYVDWPAVLEGHLAEYLWADETHLRPEGADVYVDMVVRAIAQAMVDGGGSAS